VEGDGGGGSGGDPGPASVTVGSIEAQAEVHRSCTPNPGSDREPDSGYTTQDGSLSIVASVPNGGSSSVTAQVTDFRQTPAGTLGSGFTVTARDVLAEPCTSFSSVTGSSSVTFLSWLVQGTTGVGYSIAANLSAGSQTSIRLETNFTTGEPVFYFKSTQVENGSPAGVLPPGSYTITIGGGANFSQQQDVGRTFDHTSTFGISFTELTPQ
jgi:hypothetical protein